MCRKIQLLKFLHVLYSGRFNFSSTISFSYFTQPVNVFTCVNVACRASQMSVSWVASQQLFLKVAVVNQLRGRPQIRVAFSRRLRGVSASNLKIHRGSY